MKKPCSLFFLWVLTACTHREAPDYQMVSLPREVEAKGYVVPKDSLSEPSVISVDLSGLKSIPYVPSKIVPAHANVQVAGKPQIITPAPEIITTPGQDSFVLPELLMVPKEVDLAGKPEVIQSKDAASKDQNPYNFTYFKKFQGLKDEFITQLIQDRFGNIWFATRSAGMGKYDGKNFTFYDTQQGLSKNAVMNLIEDKSGNLWLVYEDGFISRFDGKYFTHYKNTSFQGAIAKPIMIDHLNNIWIGAKGVIKFDGKSFYHFGKAQGFTDNSPTSIACDNNGNIWFYISKEGVCRYDGKSFHHYNFHFPGEDLVTLGSLVDQSGNLWMGAINTGILKFDGNNVQIYGKKEGLFDDYIQHLWEGKSGHLWIGAGEGLIQFDGKNFTGFKEEDGLINKSIYCMLEDRSGNLWLGTNGGGIAKYDGKLFNHLNEKNGLSSSFTYEIYTDKSKNVWMATYGGGICKYDGNNFYHYIDPGANPHNFIISITDDHKGNLWFGTWGGGVGKFDGKNITYIKNDQDYNDNFVYATFEDATGNLWVGTANGGVSKYDGKSITLYKAKQGFTDQIIYCILEDSKGYLWFASRGDGIIQYDGQQFVHFNEKGGLISDVTRSVVEDDSDHLWIGTNKGIAEFDGKYFTYYTEKEGLTSNEIYSCFKDSAGNLWFGTGNGLSKWIKPQEKEHRDQSVYFKNFNYEDGFLGISAKSNSLEEDGEGNLWIGASDRVTIYHPSGDVEDSIPPNVQLNEIDLFTENIDWSILEQHKDSSFQLNNGVRLRNFRFDSLSNWYLIPQHLSLAHNNNYLTFKYIGITQKSPKKVKYRYMLEGVDPTWNAITTRTEASYGNLPPNDYIFRVKAMNSEGYWSEEFHYPFTIRVPWWQRWWFRALVVGFMLSCIIGYIKWRERALKARQRLLEKTVEERTSEVVAEKQEVERQKDRSEQLLLNILPAEVAEELKQKGSAEAKQFDSVTVMFTDFKDFTQLSEQLSPADLVAEIDHCFKAFDQIISKYHIEKIKTIGDSYMAAAGLPVITENHAEEVVRAALEMQAFMEAHSLERLQSGKIAYEMRIGIHTGPVVAGIVGIKKFAYDIWGDTVNVAARMESSGEAGKVNISGTTYALIKDKFQCHYRGKVEAKHKGEVDMYFVEEVL